MVRRPKLFLFDEPLSNLDGPMRTQLRAELARLLARLAGTAIYVTHDQGEAMMLGHRIGIMREGVLQQAAPPLELYGRPANRFVAGFFGSPPMNFLDGTLVAKGEAISFVGLGENGGGASGLSLRVEPEMVAAIVNYIGKRVVLGLRPEHISDRPLPSRLVPEQSVEAVVDLVQHTGSEVCLNLAAGPHSFVARLPAASGVTGKGAATYAFDMRQAHFFDPVTEKRIGPKETTPAPNPGRP
jgi:multiple sugar transport system ATP-binding protein